MRLKVISFNKGEMRTLLAIGLFSCVGLVAGAFAFSAAPEPVDSSKIYGVFYQAKLDPTSGQANATVTLDQPRQLVRSIEFLMPPERYLNIGPSEQIEIEGDRVTWQPPKKGGSLHYDFVIGHKRDNGVDDARITDSWALFKLDHLFPRANARVVKGATSSASLGLIAPEEWAIETPYGRAATQVLEIIDPYRNFDRPRGWLLAGKLGVRRDRVGERIINVANPLGTDARANDVLAFVRWTLPSLIEVFPKFPPRLLIVSGPADMWRGGLSGYASLYLHNDRPLISGNRTSAVLHELVHVASRLHAREGADWIVEGIAEYYSLNLLFRSGGISERRYDEAFEQLTQWSEEAECVATDRSQGEQTAFAAVLMRALDAEIRASTRDESSLDTLVQALVEANTPITNAAFRAAATKMTGEPVKALAGCP
ncbi:MAG: hypothetical protein V7754_18570 [Halioglobus sp.]